MPGNIELEICFSIKDFKSFISFAPINLAKSSSILLALGFFTFKILHSNFVFLLARSFFG
jgi:hypothetical protein